jgi:hypothetical protein
MTRTEDLLQHEIVELRAHLQELEDRYMAGEIADEVYVESKDVLEDELYHLEDQLDYLQTVPEIVRRAEERADWEQRVEKEGKGG